MSADFPQHSVILLDSAGTRYTLPTYDMGGQPAPVNLAPQDPFDQVSIIGDTEKAADKRASQIIPADQTGGAGRDRYTETEGVNDYRDSEWDTRAPGAMVLRPALTTRGNIGAAFARGVGFFYVGYAGATWHMFRMGQAGKYWTGAAWTVFATPGNLYGYTHNMGYTYVAQQTRVYRSADGINFATIGGAGDFGGFDLRAMCTHDNKLWTVARDTTNKKLVLYACTDPTNPVAATATFTRVVDTPWLDGREEMLELHSWQDAAGSPMLMLLTSRRLIAYNALAGVLTDFFDFATYNPAWWNYATLPWGVTACVMQATGDLYVATGRTSDFLMKFSPGAGYEKVGPNMKGGLTAPDQPFFHRLDQNAYGLFAWSAVNNFGTGSKETTWFMAQDGGWHRLYANSSFLNGGGGYGDNKLWTVIGSEDVIEQAVPNIAALPQYMTGRSYDTTLSPVHRYGITDGGSTLLAKTLLGFTIHCVLSDGTGAFGLDPNTYVKVEYRVNGGTWTTVTQFRNTAGVITTVGTGQFTSIVTGIGWPLRTVVNNEYGVRFYELEWRVTGNTTNSANTPVLVEVAPRYIKKPIPRYTYDFVTDLGRVVVDGGMGLGGPLPIAAGYSANKMHEVLVALDRGAELVGLIYGVSGEEVTVGPCEFAMSPQLVPHLGVGRYRIVLRDVASDASG